MQKKKKKKLSQFTNDLDIIAPAGISSREWNPKEAL